MKQCPVCKTTYTDETLRYCLADGSALVDVGASPRTGQQRNAAPTSEETVFMRPAGEPVRVDIPQQSGHSAPPPAYQPAAPANGGSSGGVYKILVAVLVLGVLAVLVIAGGIFVYFKMNKPERTFVVENTNKDVKTSTPLPSPQKDDKDELRDQIANLEKLLNDQKKTNQPANIPLNLPNQPTTTTTARVNSPGDGFLALRTYPDSEVGDRILKIPHGATITVGSCTATRSLPGKRTGRWCRASYNGYTGWVFDAYLIY